MIIFTKSVTTYKKKLDMVTLYLVQFWPRFTQLLKNNSNFNNLCENFVKYGVDNKIDILVTRQNKIPTIYMYCISLTRKNMKREKFIIVLQTIRLLH